MQRILLFPLKSSQYLFHVQVANTSLISQHLTALNRPKYLDFVDRVTLKGSEYFKKMRKSNPGSLKHRSYMILQKFLDKIDYHEDFYKAMPDLTIPGVSLSQIGRVCYYGTEISKLYRSKFFVLWNIQWQMLKDFCSPHQSRLVIITENISGYQYFAFLHH